MSRATIFLPKTKVFPMRLGRIDSLQILRFLAAFLVLCGHSQHALVEHIGARAGNWGFIPFDWGLGVDVFFVISGFVMYYMMHDRFGNAGAAADFLRRRLIRIAPLYWLFTTLALVVLIATGAPRPGATNILFSYLFLPGPLCGEYCFPVFTLGWTLNYEMMFYVVFAVALPFRRTAGLAIIFAAILGLMAVAHLAPLDWRMLHFWGYPLTGEFLAGIVLAHLFLKGVRIPRPIAFAMLPLALVLAVIGYQTGAYDTIGRIVTGGIPATLIMAAAVLGLEPVGGQHVAPSGLTRLLVAGGDASYALYLSHPIAIKVAEAITQKLGLFERAPVLLLPIAIVGALIGAVIVHRVIEKPMLAFLNRRWSRFGSTGMGDGQPAPGRAGVIVTAEPESR
jgi:exopolysaccharide production protein ExoZ